MELPLYELSEIREECEKHGYGMGAKDGAIVLNDGNNVMLYIDDVYGRIDAMNDLRNNFGAGWED